MKVTSKLGDYSVEFAPDRMLPLPQGGLEIVDRVPHDLHKMDRLTDPLLVDAGETFKSMEGIHGIWKVFRNRGVTRDTWVHVIGGGTVQDACAFACAAWHRGIRWVYYPTTLLSMVDSCIGAKCGINFAGQKNALGLFSAPSEVHICTKFLDTLPKDELLSGMGEAYKLCWVGGVTSPDPDSDGSWRDMIETCLEVKQKIVDADEFEDGVRLHLSYGHTLAHALEALVPIKHGTAVCFGMMFANHVSQTMGFLDGKARDRAEEELRALTSHHGSAAVQRVDLDKIMQQITRDKKALADGTVLEVLTEGPGRMLTKPITPTRYAELLREWLAQL